MLYQRWIHSHEEDTGSEMVFRPSTFTFPPSRGRSGFELRPDQSLVEIGIAPTDGSRQETGRWEIGSDGTLRFYKNTRAVPDRTLKVTSLDTNRLVIER